MASPFISNSISTVRLEIPQINIHNKKDPSPKSEPGITVPIPSPNVSVLKTFIPCSICGTLYASTTSSTDPEQDEFIRNANELKVEVLRALCTHLHVPEFMDTLTVFKDFESGLLKTKFPLCQGCKESAEKLALLNEQVEMILMEIGILVQAFRAAICNVREGDNGHFLPNKNRRSRYKNKVGGVSSGTQNDIISRFRSLVLQKDLPGTDAESREFQGRLQNDHHHAESALDFAYIETVSSVCPSESEFTTAVVELPKIEIKTEEHSSREVSPSPAFSPISISNEDFSLNQSSPVNNWNNDGDIYGKDDVISNKGGGLKGCPWKLIGRKNKKTPKTSVERGRLKKRPVIRQFQRNQIETVGPRAQNKLQEIDSEGYATMLKLGIPFKRVEVSLTRLKMDELGIFMDPKSSSEKVKSSASSIMLSKTTEKKILKRKRLATTRYGHSDNESDDGYDLIPEPTISNDPDYCPTDDGFSEDCKLKVNSRNLIVKNRLPIRLRQKSPEIAVEINPDGSQSQMCFGVPIAQKIDSKAQGFQCTKCHKEYPDLKTLARHIRWTHTDMKTKYYKEPFVRVYKCFKRKTKDGRIMIGDTELLVNELGIHTCGTCGQFRQSQRALIQHVKIAHISDTNLPNGIVAQGKKPSHYERIIQNKEGRLFYRGFETKKTEDGKYECITCGKNFKIRTGLQEHIRFTHEKLPRKKANNSTDYSLYKIIDTPNGNKKYGPVEFRQLADDSFQCLSAYCKNNKLYDNEDDLLHHIRTTHLRISKKANGVRKTDKIYTKTTTTNDGKRFHRGTELLRTEDGKYKCGTCGRVLTRMSSLLGHIVRVHDDSSGPFVCEFPGCDKSFGYKFLFESHTLTHEMKKDYICDQCGHNFKHSSSLNNHIRQVHRKETRHECKTCGKKFFLTRDFIVHQRSHTGEKPFRCNFSGCEKTFVSIYSMRSHAKSHSEADGQLSHVCSQCQSNFESKECLKYHWLTTHAGSSVMSRTNDKPPQLARQDTLNDIAEIENQADTIKDLGNSEPPQLTPFYESCELKTLRNDADDSNDEFESKT